MSVLYKLLIFALPVIQVAFFCLVLGEDAQKVKGNLAVVNGEIDNTKTCQWKDGCKFQSLGCRYLKYIDPSLKKTYYTDLGKAKDLVRTGSSWAVVYLTENFTDAFVARAALGIDADEETIDQSNIKVWLDISNQQIKDKVKNELQHSYDAFEKELKEDCDSNPRLELQSSISLLDVNAKTH